LLESKRLNEADFFKFNKLSSTIEKVELKKAFREIKCFSILINFGSSQKLIAKLLKIHFFRAWQQFSIQDKKLVKLMGKAIKFSNRKIK
jgi:hypothetical protein